LKLRFQADADLHMPIITGLKRREPAVDFMTAKEAGLTGLDDQAVLAVSAGSGRMLVSHDVSTMPEAFRFIQERTSPGVILISQDLSYREAIEDYCESGQTLRQKTGRMCCHSYPDKTA
jgi:hypothetical protein